MLVSKRILRVLHLASFAGNIGDIANHAGARRLFSERIDFKFEFTELEIREFYWKQRQFDDAFVDYANSFDLLIIGGGNYFELWVNDSATGTSIDITLERLAKIEVPTLFYALGVDTGQGYSAQSAERFKSFIDLALERKNFYLSVRNDGSTRALRELLGVRVADLIPTMPDGGFFADPACSSLSKNETGCLGINIAGDMLERRFNRSQNIEGFLSEMANACTQLMDAKPDLSINLVPHIWRDTLLIAQLLPMIPDSYLRRRVTVDRLQPTKTGLIDFLQSYRNFDLMLGMRFHANVCAIGMGVPTRGLLNYPQVHYLYQEIGLEDRFVDVRDVGFSRNLVENALSDLNDLPAQRQLCTEVVWQLQQQAYMTLSQINNWLHQNVG